MLSLVSPTSRRLGRTINSNPLRFTRLHCICKLDKLVFCVRFGWSIRIGSDIGVGE